MVGIVIDEPQPSLENMVIAFVANNCGVAPTLTVNIAFEMVAGLQLPVYTLS